MLLAYDKVTGQVLWNSGTNSAYPEGPAKEVAFEILGRSDVGLYRLHDAADAELVEQTFTHTVRVKNGTLIFDAPDAPETPVNPGTPAEEPVTRDEFNALMTIVFELMGVEA